MDIDNFSLFLNEINEERKLNFPFSELNFHNLRLNFQKTKIKKTNISLFLESFNLNYFNFKENFKICERGCLLGKLINPIIYHLSFPEIEIKNLLFINNKFEEKNEKNLFKFYNFKEENLQLSIKIDFWPDGNKIIDIKISNLFLNIKLKYFIKLLSFFTFNEDVYPQMPESY